MRFKEKLILYKREHEIVCILLLYCDIVFQNECKMEFEAYLDSYVLIISNFGIFV